MISGVSDEHPPPPPLSHLAGGAAFWAGGAAIVWCVEALLRLAWGDPPPGPGRFGIPALARYTAVGATMGFGVSIILLPLLFHCRRWQKPLRLAALQAALFLFAVLAALRLPLEKPGAVKGGNELFNLPTDTGQLLLNLGWATIAALTALGAYWLLFRPLSSRPVGGCGHRMLALMPLLVAFGAVLTSTARWDGPVGALYTTALVWGGAASVLLTLAAGLIRRAQLWKTGVPERVGSAMPAGAALALLLVAVLAATGATPRPYDPGALVPGEPRAGEQTAERPNILIVSIDTLRADHLGCYRYPRPVSPNIDRLSREGILFEQMVCPLPRTVPALASMLTGLYPQDHGLRDNLRQTLPPEVPTLAQRLREAGYHTFAVNANGLVHPTRGLARGFDYYYIPAMEWDRAPFLRTLYDRLVSDRSIPGERGSKVHFEDGESLTRRAGELISTFPELPDNEPFFFWIHYYDPHMLYAPPSPWHRKFGQPYVGPYRKSMNYSQVSKGYMTYRCELPELARQRGVDLYDGEIGFTDQLVGRLLHTLEQTDLMEQTIVVITSDHGESLGEHDFYFDHGDFLYEPSMHIPLIIRLPGGEHAGRRVERQVTLMDLMPTLLELTGCEPAPLPTSGYGGRSLLPEINGALPAEEPARAAFGESGYCFYPQLNDRLLIKPPPKVVQGKGKDALILPDTGLRGRLRMVRRDGWKLILTPAPDGDDRLELYNLRADPKELTNLAAEEPELAESLLDQLRRWMATDPGLGEAGGTVDQTAIDRLKSLGYIQ